MKKNRFQKGLCAILVFAMVLGFYPLEGYAAPVSKKLIWEYCETYVNKGYHGALSVEAGQNYFYVGDLLSYVEDYQSSLRSYPLSTLSGARYSSSNKKVATVNAKTGQVKTMKPGKTCITIKYKSWTRKCYVTVVKKNSMGSLGSAYTKVVKIGREIAKKFGTKATRSNRYAVANLEEEYLWRSVELSLQEMDENGFKRDTSKGYQLIYPEILHEGAVRGAFGRYVTELCRVNLQDNSKSVKGKSASGKGDKVTVILHKKLTSDQAFCFKYTYEQDRYMRESADIVFPMKVYDSKTKKFYAGYARAKKGSNKVTITLNSHKLVKGRRYYVTHDNAFYEYSGLFWANQVSFVAK